MITCDELIEGGKLFKAHGYKGEINAAFDFELDREEILSLTFVFDMDGIFVPFFCEALRPKGGAWLLKFRDVDSDSELKPLINKEIWFLREQLEEIVDIEALETSDEEVIGYGVVDSDTGQQIGRVTDIEEGVEYDYLVVSPADEPGREISIPFVEDLIEEVIENEEGGTLVMRLPEGLLDLN